MTVITLHPAHGLDSNGKWTGEASEGAQEDEQVLTLAQAVYALLGGVSGLYVDVLRVEPERACVRKLRQHCMLSDVVVSIHAHKVDGVGFSPLETYLQGMNPQARGFTVVVPLGSANHYTDCIVGEINKYIYGS